MSARSVTASSPVWEDQRVKWDETVVYADERLLWRAGTERKDLMRRWTGWERAGSPRGMLGRERGREERKELEREVLEGEEQRDVADVAEVVVVVVLLRCERRVERARFLGVAVSERFG